MKFIDLFSGIGGFRLGMENNEHECVWSCEIDDYARKVYKRHWREPEASDIKEVQPEEVPEHDLICSGFPCPDFSIAGERKGFEGSSGNLFFEICRISRVRRPSWLLLENVQGLLSSQNREAFRVILESLDDIGYNVSWQVLNSKNFGVPQNRPRVFIIGHLRADGGSPFKILPIEGSQRTYNRQNGETQKEQSGLQSEVCTSLTKGYHQLRANGETYIEEGIKKELDVGFQKSVYSTDGISPTVREGHGDVVRILDKDENNLKKIISGTQGQRVYSKDGLSVALKGEAGGQGAKTGLYTDSDVDNISKDMNIRKLTPKECERLQGFPDNWTKYGLDKNNELVEISDTQRYKMVGNAVTVNVIEFLSDRFKKVEK